MIPGDILSACPHRQFHTLLGLFDSRAALSDSYPKVLRAKQGGSLYHFYDGLWYDPAGRRTHDIPCERRTPLSQSDTVFNIAHTQELLYIIHNLSILQPNIPQLFAISQLRLLINV